MNKTDKIIEILKNNISVARFGDNTIEIIGIKNAAQEIAELDNDWPKDGDTYYYPDVAFDDEDDRYETDIWNGNTNDIWRKENGLIFRTSENAIEAANKMLNSLK